MVSFLLDRRALVSSFRSAEDVCLPGLASIVGGGIGFRPAFSRGGWLCVSTFRRRSMTVELRATCCEILFCSVRVRVAVLSISSFSLKLATLNARLTLTVLHSSFLGATIDLTLFSSLFCGGLILGSCSLGSTAAMNNGSRDPCMR